MPPDYHHSLLNAEMFMRNVGSIVCCPTNPFLRFFSNKNIPFALRSKQNKVINASNTIYADQQFTENIYSGRVANLFENIPFSRKIIDNSLLQ
jgi:hypothetical protein